MIDRSSVSMLGINLALLQSDGVWKFCMHLQPPSGIELKRTPCRQANLPLILQAACFAAKLLVSMRRLALSKLTFERRLIWRARAKKRATASIDA